MKKPFSEDELRIRLAEYEEIGRCARHDGDVAWRFYALMMPASLAGLYYTYQNMDSGIIIGWVSVFLLWFAYSFYMRLSGQNRVRWDRARQIEDELGINLHWAVHDKNRRPRKNIIRGLRLRILLFLFSAFVTLFWLILFFQHLFNKVPDSIQAQIPYWI